MRLKRITSTEGEVYFVDAKTGERITTKNSDSLHIQHTQCYFSIHIPIDSDRQILFVIGGLTESWDRASILAYTLDLILISIVVSS